MQSGARLRAADYHHLGLEFEICTRLGHDLAPRKTPYTRDEMGTAVDAVCAAIELVDDRHADYAVLDCNSLVADNSWNAGVVLGNFVAPPSNLAGVVGIAYQDGTEIGRGTGADALGHPFEPLAWLANHLAAQGDGLKKGDIVMTGSIVTTRFPKGAFSYRFDVTGLGSVEVRRRVIPLSSSVIHVRLAIGRSSAPTRRAEGSLAWRLRSCGPANFFHHPSSCLRDHQSSENAQFGCTVGVIAHSMSICSD